MMGKIIVTDELLNHLGKEYSLNWRERFTGTGHNFKSQSFDEYVRAYIRMQEAKIK